MELLQISFHKTSGSGCFYKENGNAEPIENAFLDENKGSRLEIQYVLHKHADLREPMHETKECKYVSSKTPKLP